MTAVIGFLSSVFYGASDFAGGLSTRKWHSLGSATLTQLGGSIVMLAAVLVVPGQWSAAAGAAGALAGVVNVVGFLTFFVALASAPMGAVSAVVSASQSLVPVLVAVLWNHEFLSPLAWAGVCLALAGGVLIGVAEGTAGGLGSIGPLLLAAIAGALFGIAVVALDSAPRSAEFIPAALELWVSLVLMVVLAALVRVSGGVRRAATALDVLGADPAGDGVSRERGAVGSGLVSGAMLAGANIALVIALHTGSLAVAGVAVAMYPVTTAVLARVVLGERLSGTHVTGIACSICGVALLALG